MSIYDSRIEWGYGSNTSSMSYLHICHNVCCSDWNKGTIVGGDIIINQKYNSDSASVYIQLQEMKKLYPNFDVDFKRICTMIFG